MYAVRWFAVGLVFLLFGAPGYTDIATRPIAIYGADVARALNRSPDGKRIAITNENIAIVYDLASGARVCFAAGHTADINSIAFSPDSTEILTGSGDGTARLWDAESGQELRLFQGHTGSVNAAVFSPNGLRILTGSSDGTVRLWNAGTGEAIRTTPFTDTWPVILSVAFSPNGAQFAAVGAPYNPKIWNTNTGELVRTFEGGHILAANAVVFSPDGAHIATVSEDYTALLRSTSTGTIEATLSHTWGKVYSAMFSPNGATLLTAADDGVARLWNTSTYQLTRSINLVDPEDIYTIYHRPPAVFTCDTQQIITAGFRYPVQMLDAQNGTRGRTIGDPISRARSVAFSPDGARVLTTRTLWEGDTACLIRLFGGDDTQITCGALSANGMRLLTGSYGGTSRLWNATTGALIGTFTGHSGPVTSVAISGNGTRVFTASTDHTAILWNVESAQPIRTFQHDMAVENMACSSDGTRVLTGNIQGTATLWDAETGVRIRTFPGYALAFSPDGTQILAGGLDHSIAIWDTASGLRVRSFKGSGCAVFAVAFSADTTRILSGAENATVTLWNASTGREIRTFLHSSDERICSVAFAPDGQSILTGTSANFARRWSIAEAGDGSCTYSRLSNNAPSGPGTPFAAMLRDSAAAPLLAPLGWSQWSDFDMEGMGSGAAGDGIPDAWQMALIERVYCETDTPWHAALEQTLDANAALFAQDIEALATAYPALSPLLDCRALWPALMTTSPAMQTALNAIVLALTGQAAGLANMGSYLVFGSEAKTTPAPLSAAGDLDGDGFTNLEEYEHVVAAGGDAETFADAATDPYNFWAGNPAVRVHGLAGLMLLAALFGVSGTWAVAAFPAGKHGHRQPRA